MTNKHTAVVIGTKGVNAAGLIRSLGEAGKNVVFASCNAALESKYIHRYIKFSENPVTRIKEIIDFCNASEAKPVFFPTDDETAFFLDDNYETLQKHLICSNSRGKLRYLADKAVMNTLAENAGLCVPKFKKIRIVTDNDFTPEMPVIIKPYAGFAGDKSDICICANDDEYKKALQKLKQNGYTEVIVQKLLDSDKQEEIGLMGIAMSNGKVIIPGIIHKIRSYPNKRGSTSYARFSPDTNGLKSIDKIIEFVKSTGYTGLFDIEMILSNGVEWFIEINYRNGQYGYTPTAAGYNLPVNWYKAVTGGNADKPNNIKEVYYMNEREDYRHVKDGEISRKEWLEEFRKVSAYGMYCPGDQRPFIRQYVKIPDRFKICFKIIKSKFKDLAVKEEWSIAIRPRTDVLLYESGGTDKPFTVLKNSLRYWAADPFIISDKEKDFLFFEMYDRFMGKGLIGFREINGDNDGISGRIGKMKIAYEQSTHLSFPFIFKYNGYFYMMPESSEAGNLVLLKAVDFPYKWEPIETLAVNKRFVDSVMLENDGNIFLFTHELGKSDSFDTLDIYIKEGNSWLQHKKNPVVNSASNSRLAGTVFEYHKKRIRVSQDCAEEYGKMLHFNSISELTSDKYEEQPVADIGIGDIDISSRNKYSGIHTYNFSNRYEVIDLKNTERIRFGNLINILYKIKCKLTKNH